ncbi:MAG: sodium-translocating pyrophosphatase, partial [Crenarchaeota archaeon]|nr:sodium-translocating pyrophosphatase [Thermoproteota archaeon]
MTDSINLHDVLLNPFSIIIFVSAVVGVLVALYLRKYIISLPSGTERMILVHRAIREGSEAYLKRQYRTVLMISIVIALIVYLAIDLKIYTGIPYISFSFLLGAIFSLLAGWLSMDVATLANVKVAQAARGSQAKPLKIAFYGGLVLGLMVVSMSLLGIAILFFGYWAAFGKLDKVPELIMGFGFGASLAALFAQLGGGIYTKGADVGADLVGKVEVGIPEDDPRNPATIADNVGDNVGDCAGRGADLFESISAENIGSMIIGASLFLLTKQVYFILFPIVARAFGLLATLGGALFVRPKEPKSKDELINPLVSLRNGLIASVLIISVMFYFIMIYMFGSAGIYLYIASLAGLLAALAIEVITEYYTGEHIPVKRIAKAAETGPATDIHMGLSVGMESTGLPVVIVAMALIFAYILGQKFAEVYPLKVQEGIAFFDPKFLGGIYGTVAATIGMLSLTGIILAMDGYGPIADNAGGIIEMSGIEEEVGKTADVLDAAGNTTKALAKGFAMGSAAMAALLLFQAYLEVIVKALHEFTGQIVQYGQNIVLNLAEPAIIIGLMLGAILPFVFSAFAIRAVGSAAGEIINEVRRQFREKPGILEWKEKPDYAKVVDITTKAAQKSMVIPSLLSLAAPIAVGIALGYTAVGGFLLGVTVSGIALAFFMN